MEPSLQSCAIFPQVLTQFAMSAITDLQRLPATKLKDFVHFVYSLTVQCKKMLILANVGLSKEVTPFVVVSIVNYCICGQSTTEFNLFGRAIFGR